jgi:hypothetical protein
MRLITQNYREQQNSWPKSGRHILAQYDDESIVVYQAYRPEIGDFAAKHGYFGGAFSLSRMSWIKPNFLWMMYRSGWAGKEGQEVVLALRLRRAAFDEILACAVHSAHLPEVYGSREAWASALSQSEVRLQWDPDHDPNGTRQERRAIQLGLRGETLRSYSKDWILEIEDVTDFVHAERERRSMSDSLMTPRERVYPVADLTTRERLGISEWGATMSAEAPT